MKYIKAVSIICSCIVIGVFLKSILFEKNIVNNSTILLDVNGWYPKDIHVYKWMNSTKLRYYLQEKDVYFPITYDLISKISSENKSLSKLLLKYDNDIWAAEYSPSSKFILLVDDKSNSIYNTNDCVPLFSWKEKFPGIWQTDSLLLLTSWTNEVKVIGEVRLNNKSQKWEKSFFTKQRQINLGNLVGEQIFSSNDRVFTILPDSIVNAESHTDKDYLGIVRSYDIFISQNALTEVKVLFPKVATVRGCFINATYDEILWYVKYEKHPDYYAKLNLSRFKMFDKIRSEFWITNLKGENKSLIGVHSEAEGMNEDKINGISWIPGENSFTYIYHNHLLKFEIN